MHDFDSNRKKVEVRNGNAVITKSKKTNVYSCYFFIYRYVDWVEIKLLIFSN